MEGDSIYNSLSCFSIYLLLTGILSEDSLSPGPVVYVINDSNVTFACSTTQSWNVMYFYDSGIQNNNLARVIFQGNKTHCRHLYTDPLFGPNKYTPLTCNVGQPVSIVVLHINASYHNKSIACKVDSGVQIQTTVKIRENLTTPIMNPIGTQTIKVNMTVNFTCTASSIPKPSITWHIKGSGLIGAVTTSSLNERTIHSTITYQANKQHHNMDLYCSANNSFTTTISPFAKLNILYVPTVHIYPTYEPYIMYDGQSQVKLICALDDANPLDDITYHWTKPGGYAEGQNVSITTVSRTDSGQYRCLATNVVGNSSVSNKEIRVQYIPLITNIYDISIIEGKTLEITPTVDANPTALSVWWTHANNLTVRFNELKLTINKIQREASGDYTCHAMNVLTPSGMNEMNRTNEKSINIDVQYLPEIHIDPSFDPYIIYHKQQDVVLTCVVDKANPANITAYRWITPSGTIVKTQNITITTVAKSHKGVYTCTATNKAGPSEAKKQTIIVQYGPSILNIGSQEDIKEGSTLQFTPKVDANPLPGFVWWTRTNNIPFRYDGFNLTIQNIQRDATGNYSCYVMNTVEPSGLPAKNMTVEWMLYINVQYAPSTEIAEAPKVNVLEHDTITLHCKVRDANPIKSSIVWYHSAVRTLQSTTNFTITNIHRSAAGDYICEARNTIGNGTTSVNVNVLYGPDITSLRVINGSTADENSSVFLKCEVDSNPAPDVLWTFNDIPMQDNSVNAGLSYYYIAETTCFQTGIYSCIATNEIFQHNYNASRDVELFVNCSPRLNINMELPPNKIGLPLGGTLNLSVHIVAYPELTTSEWIFRPNFTKNLTYNIKSEPESNSFRHVIHLFKPNITETDFGDYSLEVQNDVGSNGYRFYIVPEGPPEPSDMINATCDVQTALIYWVTAFSGGDTQTFSVIVVSENMKIHLKTDVVSNAKGEIKHTLLNMSPGDYTFIILGENKYDSAISSNSISCQVKENPKAQKKSVVAAAAGGGVGAAAVLIAVIILTLVIVKKRRIVKGNQFEENRKKLTDEDTEEGLKDNPLYGTSQNIIGDSGPMYSVVNSKRNVCKNDGSVYSQVQKNATKGNNKMNIEMEEVYENSDKILTKKDEIYANAENDYERKQNQNGLNDHLKKNKDGLIYADLELAPSGKRFVIRGIENRNNYAIIDLSKTAEPLPSDDENEEQGINENESAANNE